MITDDQTTTTTKPTTGLVSLCNLIDGVLLSHGYRTGVRGGYYTPDGLLVTFAASYLVSTLALNELQRVTGCRSIAAAPGALMLERPVIIDNPPQTVSVLTLIDEWMVKRCGI